jgi:hypothetical protein
MCGSQDTLAYHVLIINRFISISKRTLRCNRYLLKLLSHVKIFDDFFYEMYIDSNNDANSG